MEYKLPKIFEGVRIVSSQKTDGSMNIRTHSGLENALKFLQKNNIALPFCFTEQTHETEIATVSKPGSISSADGLLTKENFVLAVRTADCVPLILYARNSGLIGAIHISRRNLIAGMISNSLKSALLKKKIQPNEVGVFLGPHIRAANYEIKDDISRVLRGSKWEKFIKEVGSKYFFDLTAGVICEFEEIGIMRDNIADCKIDTFTSDIFFSARRQKPDSLTKTFLTVVYKNGD